MERSQVIAKIEKLLRLSKSSNPNEAATALRHAQAWMEKHGLTEHDVLAEGWGNATVDCPIQANKNKLPIILVRLTDLIEKAFGVACVVDHTMRETDVSYTVRYFGPMTRVTMACYAHTVVYRAMEAAWREYLKENPEKRGERGSRSSFQVYWLHAVSEKVSVIGFSEEENEIVKKEMAKVYKNLEVQKASAKLDDMHAAMSGLAAAEQFNINRPMQQERTRLEKL